MRHDGRLSGMAPELIGPAHLAAVHAAAEAEEHASGSHGCDEQASGSHGHGEQASGS
jgi:hypothetical protein